MSESQADRKYTVWQFFSDYAQEKVLEHASDEEAARKAVTLSLSVGSQIGTTTRIIITDDDDYTVFEWVFGKGVVFPIINHEDRVLVHAGGGACHGKPIVGNKCSGCGIAPDMQSTAFWPPSQVT